MVVLEKHTNIARIISFTRSLFFFLSSLGKSSYLGLGVFILTSIIDKRKINTRNFALASIFLLLFLIVSTLTILLIPDPELGNYIKSLGIWILPVFFFALARRDFLHRDYKFFIVLIVIHALIELVLTNYTTLQFYEADRQRSAIFGFIRSNGFTNNASISSSVLVALFYMVVQNGKNNWRLTVVFLIGLFSFGSGVGFMMFFLGFVLLKYKELFKFKFYILFILLLYIFLNYNYDVTLHPKISSEYILYIIQNKFDAINSFFDQDEELIFFGESIVSKFMSTSGDFGYLIVINSIGILPSILLYSFLLFLYIRSIKVRNFIPATILSVSSFHYPVFIDPFSAFLLVQLSIHNKDSK